MLSTMWAKEADVQKDLLRDTYMRWVIAEQTEEESGILKLRSYYEGQHGMDITEVQEDQLLMLFTQETIDYIRKHGFINLVYRAVQVILERLEFKQFVPVIAQKVLPGEQESIPQAAQSFADVANEWWKRLELENKQQDLYEYALRDKASLLIVGWDEVAGLPTMDVNELWDGESGQCRLHFDTDTGNLLFVSKRWNTVDPDTGLETGDVRRTLYFSNRIERYISDDSSVGGWRMMTSEELADEGVKENPQPWIDARGKPLGIAAVPAYNVKYVSEGFGLPPLHDSLNRSIMDLLLSGAYEGIPMLAFEGGVQFQKDPMTGLEKPPKVGPGRAIAAPGGTVKRIESADLEMVFRGGPMSFLTLAAYAKGWPIHVFTRIHPAADTIRASETSLVKQCDAKKVNFGQAWLSAFRMANKLSELYAGKLYAGDIECQWATSESENEALDIKNKELKADAARLPDRWRLRLFGYGEDEIAQIMKEKEAESKQRVQLSLADTVPDVQQ